MAVKPSYETLPLSWEEDPPQASSKIKFIIYSSVDFSENWTKARIVMLAHEEDSEESILQKIKSEFEKENPRHDSATLDQILNKDYVIEVINAWKLKRFEQEILHDFEVYASVKYENIFLINSSSASFHVGTKVPKEHFYPLFNIKELFQKMKKCQVDYLTLSVHGYGSPGNTFYERLIEQGKELNDSHPDEALASISQKHFLIGYHWPSEQLFKIKLGESFKNFLEKVEIFLKLFTVLFLVPVIGVTVLFTATEKFLEALKIIFPSWWGIISTVFLSSSWILLFVLLRLLVYQRDRTRVIYYGAPDLTDFLFQLDKVLTEEVDETTPPDSIEVNLLGHSMGALLLVMVLRNLLIERQGRKKKDYSFNLDKLLLVAPDIPLAFLQDNRVRSAMRQCKRIYLMSSDRDIVLRYLSSLANWFSEPSIKWAGFRLGNIYLKKLEQEELPLPLVRSLIRSQDIIDPKYPYEILERINYIDCSEMDELNGVKCLSLNFLTGLIIDFFNSTLHLLSRINVHGAYFKINTPSFKILKCLVTAENKSSKTISERMNKLIKDTKIGLRPFDEDPIERYYSVPIGGRFIYKDSDFTDFLNTFQAQDPTGDYVEIYNDTDREMKWLEECDYYGIDQDVLPALVIWETNVNYSNNKVISLKDLSFENIFKLIEYLVEEAKHRNNVEEIAKKANNWVNEVTAQGVEPR